MKKIIVPLLLVFSLILVILGTVFLAQTILQGNAKADGTVSYNETWTATSGTYAGMWYDYSYYRNRYGHLSGLPGNKAECAYAIENYYYGVATAIDCSATVTQWSVTGTINSGTSGVKRYFVASKPARYNYEDGYYGNLQTLTSSYCNSDANNPGGYFHPHLDGAYTGFAINGTTVQGPYGTGVAGQDNYIQSSSHLWLSRAGQYGYLQSGKVLAGTTYVGTDTSPTSLRYILCVED